MDADKSALLHTKERAIMPSTVNRIVRVAQQIAIVSLTGLLIFSATQKTNAVDIDLIQLLQSRESSVENNGDREEFYKAA